MGRLFSLQQNQNLSVVYAAHEKMGPIRLQLISSPLAMALLEYDCQQCGRVYDHNSSSVLNWGLGLSGAFRPIPSRE